MMRRLACGLAFLTLATPAALPYIRYAPNGGAPLIRTDFANIPFRVNQSVAPGLVNADGQPMITADSDPVGAIRLALASWNSIPTSQAHFAALETTSAVNDPTDGMNVIVFRDTPEIRSVLGARLATTVYVYFLTGQIVETDILFNPTSKFSTTLAADTYDIQAVIAHELGHALGANHTGILSATMFHATASGQSSQKQLSADDIMFASTTYPVPGASPFGTISGRITASDGSPVRGGLVTALDLTTGNAIGALSSLADGAYSFQAPPGDYFVSVEPLGGALLPQDLYLTAAQTVDTAVQPGFVGGMDTPAIISVTPGSVSYGDLSLAAGASAIRIQLTATGPAGGAGDVFYIGTGPQVIPSGGASDLLFWGLGMDASLTDGNIKIIGPGVIVRPGSVRIEPGFAPKGIPVMRVTLDVAARLNTASATLVVSKDGNTAVFSSGLILSPSQ